MKVRLVPHFMKLETDRIDVDLQLKRQFKIQEGRIFIYGRYVRK